MALVAAGYELNVTLVDRGLNQVTKTYEMTATTAADAATDAATILAALNAVTDASIKGYRLSTVFAEDAFATPNLGEVENQAMLIMRLDGDPFKKASHFIPAPVDGIFVAGQGPNYNIVDNTDALVTTYVALFQGGGEAYISDGETVDVLEKGHRIHRQSNKG